MNNETKKTEEELIIQIFGLLINGFQKVTVKNRLSNLEGYLNQSQVFFTNSKPLYIQALAYAEIINGFLDDFKPAIAKKVIVQINKDLKEKLNESKNEQAIYLIMSIFLDGLGETRNSR